MEENKKTDVILTVSLIASSVLLVYTLGMRRGYKVAVRAMNSVIDHCINAFEVKSF